MYGGIAGVSTLSVAPRPLLARRVASRLSPAQHLWSERRATRPVEARCEGHLELRSDRRSAPRSMLVASNETRGLQV